MDKRKKDKQKKKDRLIKKPVKIRRKAAKLQSAKVPDKNITAEQVEGALGGIEARLLFIQRNAKIGNWDWNPVTNELYWSSENYRIFGLDPKKVSPSVEAFLDTVDPADLEFVKRSIDDALNDKKPYNIDIRIIRPDGTKCIVNARAEVVFDNTGKAVRMSGTVQDITELKQLEEKVYLLSKIIESAPDGIHIADINGRMIYSNKAAEKIFGFADEESRGRHINEWHPDKEFGGRVVIPALKEHGIWTGETTVKHKDGREFPIWLTTSMVKNNKGEPVAMMGIIRDITESKRAEEVFKESEYKYRTLVGNIPDYVARFDRQYRHIFVNEKTFKDIGTTFEQMINKSHRDMGYPAHLCDLFEGTMDEVFKTGQPCEKTFEWESPSGLRIIEWRAFPEFTFEGKVKTILALCRDITEQKQLANALQRANEELEIRVKERTAEMSEMNKTLMSEIAERKKIEEELHTSAVGYRKLLHEFHALFDAIPDSLVLMNLKKEIIWANKSAAHDFGMEDESGLLGHSYIELCNKIKDSSEDCPAAKSLFSGKEEQSQILTKSQNILDIRAFPILDESGRVQSVIELSRDITSKIQAEKEAKQMHAELIRTNRMTSLGTLVSGVVHEINNPNSFILSNSEVLSDIWKDAGRILKEYCSENNIQRLGNLSFSEALEVAPELIKGIIYGSVRINNIVSNLKNFSRPATTGIWGRVSSGEVIMSSSTILSSQLSKYTDNFHINCNEGIPYFKGNFQQIEQVIINIILNAFQSLPHKNCGVWVSDSFDEKSGVIIIQVKDNGIGIPEDIIDRITEPFFTTRIEQGGTGLGLSISYSIISEHSGTLEFESSPGAGTTVTVKLPVYNPAS